MRNLITRRKVLGLLAGGTLFSSLRTVALRIICRSVSELFVVLGSRQNSDFEVRLGRQMPIE